MRIGFTAELFPPAWEGGRSLRIYETAKAIVSLGHEVHVYCYGFPNAPEYEVLEGIHVHRIGLNVPSISSYTRRVFSSFFFLKLFFEKGFDVVNTNTLFPCLPTYFTVKIEEKPIVFTTDGLLIPRLKRLSLTEKGWFTREFTIFLEKFISRRKYDAVIAVSNYVKEEMMNIGVPEDRIHIVYSGVDLRKYDAVKMQERKDESVIYIGNLLPHKGVDDLINAIKTVKKSTPKVKLQVVGSGPLLEQLKNQVLKLNMSKNVIFHGRISDEEKIRLIKSSSCLVLPSIMESFGLVFLEAMVCKRPVIAYDIPAARETITDGYNGFLVHKKNVGNLANKINEILSNKKKANRMGENGRKRVEEKFTWRKTAEETLSVYNNLLN